VDRHARSKTLVLLVRVIDGTGAAAIERGEVIIRGDRILHVGVAGVAPSVSDANVLSVDEGTILPGLIDFHAHPKAHYLSWFLAAGITTVRDATNDLGSIRAFDTVGPFRPRVVWAGPVLDGERAFFRQLVRSFSLPESVVDQMVRKPDRGLDDGVIALVVTDAKEAEAAVDLLADRGGSVIKLYEQLSIEPFAAAIARARHHGLPTMADLGMISTRGLDGAEIDLLQAARCGVGSIEHVSGAALAYQRLGGDPFGHSLDVSLVDTLARSLVDHNVALVPTLMVTHYRAADPIPDLVAENVPLAQLGGPVADSLDEQWRQMHGEPGTDRSKPQADLRLQRAVTHRVHELGGV
jgi:hypothetical protein